MRAGRLMGIAASVLKLSFHSCAVESPSGLSRRGPSFLPHIVLVLLLPDLEVWHMWLGNPAKQSPPLGMVPWEGFLSVWSGPSQCEQGSD